MGHGDWEFQCIICGGPKGFIAHVIKDPDGKGSLRLKVFTDAYTPTVRKNVGLCRSCLKRMILFGPDPA